MLFVQSRPLFNKSMKFEDFKNFEVESISRRPSVKCKMLHPACWFSMAGQVPFTFIRGAKSGRSSSLSSRQNASRPKAMSMDFVVRPQSKVDPDEVRARAKRMAQDQRHAKMEKKLQQLAAPKHKQLQATKLSVAGRGMVKYL
ncbi:hypothetical protein ACJIZ3_015629 [Penstemon smallii]|uniref:Uncharacterized protein n=1 Tax=Penstemon smallii TaxID=265156 RepID=A0ABD3RTK2_9LAMI